MSKSYLDLLHEYESGSKTLELTDIISPLREAAFTALRLMRTVRSENHLTAKRDMPLNQSAFII